MAMIPMIERTITAFIKNSVGLFSLQVYFFRGGSGIKELVVSK